ncbi:MAG: glycosyltransferase family 4 protein [Patescibacteria group bacterium]
MTTKRILIATGIYPPSIGGPATYAKLLNDLLPQEGFDVKVLSFDVVRKYPKVLRHSIYFTKLFLLGFGVDVLFIQDTVSVGLPALMVSKILRKKMILRVPGDYAWEQGVQRFGVKEDIDHFQDTKSGGMLGFIRRVQFFVAKYSDIVIVPSHYFKTVVSKWGVKEERLHVIYNGIEKINIERKKNNSNNDFVLISAGRLVPWKGFGELINAFAEVRKNILNAKLIIVGDGPCKNELEDLSGKLGLEHAVNITGRLPREKLLSLMSESDIFVLNSGFESFSFQVVEAMALGCVIVSADSGSLKEIVEDGVSGLLFKSTEPYGMIPLINKLRSDRAMMERLSANAILRSKKFSFENTIIELKKVL